MPYEITIKKTSEKTTIQRGDYGVIEKVFWTDEDLKERSGLYRFGEPTDNEYLKKNPLKEIMGYRPSREVTEKVETEVLRQTVDDLDIAAVIKAINKL